MSSKRGQIIIVDDNAHWREELAEMLTEKEYSVVTVANQENARQQLAQKEFDVAILDVNLADSSDNVEGIILNQYIKQKYENLSVILISARSLTEEELEEIKPAAFISKSDIWEKLESYLSLIETNHSGKGNQN